MPTTSEQHPRELLPWLVNQTLSEAERAQVEAHVANCTACQAELQLLQAMHNSVQAQAYGSAGDIGLQRLRRSLRQDVKTRTPRWVLPAALAAGLVIAVQSALLLQPPQDRYELLGGPRAGEYVMQVMFMPEASEAELRALLREKGLRIVDGPSAAGLYRLALEPERDPESVVVELQARDDLIRHLAREH